MSVWILVIPWFLPSGDAAIDLPKQFYAYSDEAACERVRSGKHFYRCVEIKLPERFNP